MLLHTFQHTHQFNLLFIPSPYRQYQGMLQQLLCTFTVCWAFLQTTTHKIPQLLRPRIQRRRLCMYYLLHCLGMLHSKERWLTLYKFYSNHSQRPNIYLLIVRLLFYQFRRHPRRSSHQRLPIEYLFCKLYSEPKICDFNLAFHAHENIVTFEIPMKLSVRMKAIQTLQHFFQDISNYIFWYFFEIIIDKVNHGPSIHKFYKHKERLFIVISKKMFSEIVTIAEIHDCDLGFDFVESTMILEFDNTAGIVTPVFFLFVVGEENFAHRSLTQLLLKHKLAGWVFLDKVDIFYDLLEFFCREQLLLDVTLQQIRLELFRIGLRMVQLFGPFRRQVFEVPLLVHLHVKGVLDSGGTKTSLINTERIGWVGS